MKAIYFATLLPLVFSSAAAATQSIPTSVDDRPRDGQSQPMIPADGTPSRWGPHAPGGAGGGTGTAATGSRWGPQPHGGQGGYRSGAAQVSCGGAHPQGGQGGCAGTGSQNQ